MSIQSVCREYIHSFYNGISDESGGKTDIQPKTMNEFSTDRLNTSLFLFLLHTIHALMLVWWIVCMFTLGTILYKKVVPAMWSPFRDHIAGDHIKQAIN